MALSYLKARGMRGPGLRTRGSARCVVRAQAGSDSTSVQFKMQRHLEYGQSLLLVGSIPELGSWDAKRALELNWGDGDNWTIDLTLPKGAAVEYKYIVKRKDVLDWCPGPNKGFTFPAAASVLVLDAWDSAPSTIAPIVLSEADKDIVEASSEQTTAEVEVVTLSDAALQARSNAAVTDAPLNATSSAAQELVTAVNTVENLHIPELENAILSPAVLAAQHQPSPGFLANNIVQAVPLGAIAVSQDPITQYEEADKYQVVEVCSTERVGAAVALKTRDGATATINGKLLDKMTMAELRNEAKRRGMSPLGNRRELVTRLQNAGIV